jgi:hypothetical protein
MISGIALCVCLYSSPSRILRPSHARANPDALSRNVHHTLDGRGWALSSAMPGASPIDAHHSACIEEEDESPCSCSHLVSLAYIELDWPSKLLSGVLPCPSPSTAVVVPLRC